ncbi:hypothetical protein [Streptomyces sp. NPDC002067]
MLETTAVELPATADAPPPGRCRPRRREDTRVLAVAVADRTESVPGPGA